MHRLLYENTGEAIFSVIWDFIVIPGVCSSFFLVLNQNKKLMIQFFNAFFAVPSWFNKLNIHFG